MKRLAFVWEEDYPAWFRYMHRCVAHAMLILLAALFFAWVGLPFVPEALFVVLLGLVAAAFVICFWPFFFTFLKAVGYFWPWLNEKVRAVDAALERDKPLPKNEDALMDEWTSAPNSRLSKTQLRRTMERYARKSNGDE